MKRYCCPECGKCGKTPDSLFRHLVSKHAYDKETATEITYEIELREDLK